MPDKLIVVALPLDHHAAELIETAGKLAKLLGASLVPVHSVRASDELLSHVRKNGGVRPTLESWVSPLVEQGVEVLEPVLDGDRAERLVPTLAARLGAELTVVGANRGSSVRDWLLGTTAERIIRASSRPVFVARGTLPGPGLPVLAPVSLSDEARLSILAAARWARLFGAEVRVLHVLSGVEPGGTDETLAALDTLEREARATLERIVASIDPGCPVHIHLAHGPVSATLEKEAHDAGLVVIVHPDYADLVPASLGSPLEHLIRTSRASVVAIRDIDPASQRKVREERARWVATLLEEADAAMGQGDPARAERLLTNAKVIAMVSPKVEDALASALDAQGRHEEADRHRALARWLRNELA